MSSTRTQIDPKAAPDIELSRSLELTRQVARTAPLLDESQLEAFGKAVGRFGGLDE